MWSAAKNIGFWKDRIPDKRILLVDSHPILLEGLVQVLKKEPSWKVVGKAVSGKQARECFKALNFDLLITETYLPDVSGYQLIELAKTLLPEVKVLVLARQFQPPTHPDQMMAINGYLLKKEKPETLLKAIKRAFAGKTYCSESLRYQLNLPGKQAEDRTGFTPREAEIVSLINKGFTTDQIAEILYVDVYAIRKHKQRIFSKARKG